MTGFSCEHCGASLELPADPAALDAECPFCARHTTLPREILALRQPKVVHVASPPPSSPVAGLVAIGVVLVLGIVASSLILHRSHPVETVTTTTATRATEPGPRTPPPPPRAVNPTDRRTTGEAAVSERLTELHARGCKDVILAPAQTSGEQTVDTKFVLNGRCITVLAITGAPQNVLTLTMSTPLGAPIETPAPSTHIEVTVCPKMAGQHPTRILPATDDTYTVAAIECPAGKKTP